MEGVDRFSSKKLMVLASDQQPPPSEDTMMMPLGSGFNIDKIHDFR